VSENGGAAYRRVNIVSINEAQDDEIYVIDDFLRDPLALRGRGLQAEYPVPLELPWYPGRDSRRKYPIAELDEAIGQITGRAVTPLPDSSHTKFRLCLANEIGKGGVHIDNCHWTGVYFLTLDEHAQGGTDFFRHRPSGTLRAPVYPEDWRSWPFDTVAKLWNDVIHPHTNDASQWDLVRRVPMKFNRLVLFRPWQWHNAGAGFGDRPENGRLIYLLSYNSV